MAIKIGHASIDERGKASGGVAGDQSGGEVCTRSWYSSPWDVVLRPKSAEVAEKSAKACEAACANNHIGYDQYQRNTLYHHAKSVGFDLSKITDNCECDCSSLMHVCAIAGGANLSYGANGFWTGNMVNGMSGEYKVLTDNKYLTSDAYLKRGDILLRTSGHTAMVLENGSKSGKVTTEPESTGGTTMLTSLPLLKMGSEGDAVWSMQVLLTARGYNAQGNDGKFGSNTHKALCQFQRDAGLEADGKCGKLTWSKLIDGGQRA